MKTLTIISFSLSVILIAGCASTKTVKQADDAYTEPARVTKQTPEMNVSPARVAMQAPDSFVEAYTSALNAFEIDDWGAMSAPLSKARQIASEHSDNTMPISIIMLLQAVELFDNDDPKELIIMLDEILVNRVMYESKVTMGKKKQSPNKMSGKHQKLIQKKLGTTNDYISQKGRGDFKIRASQTDEDTYSSYSNSKIGSITKTMSSTELLVDSIQLITYAIIKSKTNQLDTAYEAIRTVSVIDKVYLERTGYIISPEQKKLIARNASFNELKGNEGKELLSISKLLESDRHQDALQRIKVWLSEYPRSTDKRLGIANLIYSESLPKSHKLSLVKLEVALQHFNNGFGNGNALSGLVEYKILSTRLNKVTKYASPKNKKKAINALKQIDGWRERYVKGNASPAIIFFNNILIDVSGMIHQKANIPSSDKSIQNQANAMKEAMLKVKGGDLNAMQTLLMTMSINAQKNKKQVSLKEVEEDISKLYVKAIMGD